MLGHCRWLITSKNGETGSKYDQPNTGDLGLASRNVSIFVFGPSKIGVRYEANVNSLRECASYDNWGPQGTRQTDQNSKQLDTDDLELAFRETSSLPSGRRVQNFVFYLMEPACSFGEIMKLPRQCGSGRGPRETLEPDRNSIEKNTSKIDLASRNPLMKLCIITLATGARCSANVKLLRECETEKNSRGPQEAGEKREKRKTQRYW